MKVIFFVDDLQDHTTILREKLKKNYSCFQSQNPDEMNQVFHQSGKFALVFADGQSAGQFVQADHPELGGTEYKIYCYLPRNARYKPASQKVLDQLRVNVFIKDEEEKLVKNINDFFAGTKSDALNVDEIEFILPEGE